MSVKTFFITTMYKYYLIVGVNLFGTLSSVINNGVLSMDFPITKDLKPYDGISGDYQYAIIMHILTKSRWHWARADTEV